MTKEEIKRLSEKIDEIILLLKFIGGSQIEQVQKKRNNLLTVPNKRKIYDLCSGKNDLDKIAKKVGVTTEYVRQTTIELAELGLVDRNILKGKSRPKKVIMWET